MIPSPCIVVSILSFKFNRSERSYSNPDDWVRILLELEEESENEAQPVVSSDEDEERENVSEIISNELCSSDSELSVCMSDSSEHFMDIDNTDQDECKFYIGRDGESLWINKTISTTSKAKAKNIVKIFPGPTSCARKARTPLETFSLFISPEMIDRIVFFTNKYIDKKKHDVKYSRERDVPQNTTKSEIQAFLGTLLLLAVKRGNSSDVREYWSTDGTGFTVLRALFSYKRFLFILRSIRFDDIYTREKRLDTDKLAAFREFHQQLVENCKKNYSPGEFVTIDEMLHPFRGRCGFVQYMPNKPAKYGLKLYALCDSRTFYTYNFEVYCGKQKPGPYSASNTSGDVVKRLVQPIENSNRNLTTDNYYTSYPLAEYLLQRGITLLGTMKKNKREIPPEFLPSKLRQPNSSLFGFQPEFTIVSYVPKKNKAVILLSTMHDTADIDGDTNKPEMIMDYNRTKGGVDCVDYKCASYTTTRRTRRWPLSLFFRHLDIAGINAFIIYTANHFDAPLRRKDFLKKLAFSLFEEQLAARAMIDSLPKDLRLYLESYRLKEEVQCPPPERKVGPCHCCGAKKNNKTTVRCVFCKNFVCKAHSKSETKCTQCLQLPIND